MAFDYKTDYYKYRQYFLKVKDLYQYPVAKASLALILTLLTISFFGLFAIKPTIINIGKLIKEIKDLRQVNQTLEKKITSLNQAQKTYAEITDNLYYLDWALPKGADFNRFASEISLLIFNNKLVTPSASFGEFELISNEKEEQILKFRLTLAGKFIDIKSFLRDLENLDRIVKIGSVSFSTKTEISGSQVQAVINGEAFWLPNN